MLNGLDPVLIFQISKLLPDSVGEFLSDIPLVSKIPNVVDMPPIPIYLSERLTGLIVVAEDKNVDIETDTNTLSNGDDPVITQKGIGSSVSITIEANKKSIGISTLSALIDTVFDKLTSREYSVSYLHGSTTIFRGLIAGYQVSQGADNDLLTIQLTITKGKKQPTKQETPKVGRITDGASLNK